MCNCIAEIVKKTEQREDGVYAEVGSNNSQSSQISWLPITLAGVPSKHHRYGRIPWKYCPFCGEQIELS